jgi:hypothetical protein
MQNENNATPQPPTTPTPSSPAPANIQPPSAVSRGEKVIRPLSSASDLTAPGEPHNRTTAAINCRKNHYQQRTKANR